AQSNLGEAVRLGLLFSVVLLLGGFHQVVWMLLFLVLAAVWRKRLRLPALVVAVVFGATSLYRLVPAALTLKPSHFASGYPSIGLFLESLLTVRSPEDAMILGLPTKIGWWEFDLFVGWIGVGFLATAGVVPLVRGWADLDATDRAFAKAAGVLAVASFGLFFMPLCLSPLPVLNTQRTPSRFMIVPFLVLSLFAARRLEGWLRGWTMPKAVEYGAVALLVQFAVELFHHACVWRVEQVEQWDKVTGIDLAVRIVPPLEAGEWRRPYYETLFLPLAGICAALFLILAGWSFIDAVRNHRRPPA
ncbi:MAG: hypothetical protein ACRDD1_13980, partial [Planctomycetia bacterium]